MTEWDRQMALRGIPPSDSHHGWNFKLGHTQMRWPVGWALAGILIFSGLVWAAIIFH